MSTVENLSLVVVVTATLGATWSELTFRLDRARAHRSAEVASPRADPPVAAGDAVRPGRTPDAVPQQRTMAGARSS